LKDPNDVHLIIECYNVDNKIEDPKNSNLLILDRKNNKMYQSFNVDTLYDNQIKYNIKLLRKNSTFDKKICTFIFRIDRTNCNIDHQDYKTFKYDTQLKLDQLFIHEKKISPIGEENNKTVK